MRVASMAGRIKETKSLIYTCDRPPSVRPEDTFAWRRIVVIVLCIGFSVLFSYRFRSLHGGTTTLDLGELYYGARCAIHHQDPYLPSTVLKTFHADGGTFPTDMVGTRVAPIVIGVNVYPPTTLFLIVPFALLPYSAAQTLWTLLTVVLLSLAGYLIWTVADLSGQVLAGWLVAIV